MDTIYDELYRMGKKRAKHEIWVFSDLQQKLYDNAVRCLTTCMNDYEQLDRPAEMIWYLGDSTESSNLPELIRMTDLQEKAFGDLNIPLCYATGNHDYDYPEFCHRQGMNTYTMPFYEMVQRHPGWHTTGDTEETWFRVDVGNYAVWFFCDHVAKDNSWCSTHWIWEKIRSLGQVYSPIWECPYRCSRTFSGSGWIFPSRSVSRFPPGNAQCAAVMICGLSQAFIFCRISAKCASV